MMWGELPPVGTPFKAVAGGDLPHFHGYHSLYLQSGTAALAQAMLLCRVLRPEVPTPKVILPAYGCPDLLAAAVYSGLQPVLVDIQAEDPGFDLDDLAKALSGGDVIAIVAVNFLGIAENLAELSRLAKASGARLIEDNAQWFPEDYIGTEITPITPADFVLTSFGRGKPLNLLGGGALWVANHLRTELEQSTTAFVEFGDRSAEELPAQGLAARLKAQLFTMILKPLPYYFASRLPFLNIGATEYHALEELGVLPARTLAALPSNLKTYLAAERWREDFLKERLQESAQLINLPVQVGGRAGRLLRYPVLLKDASVEIRHSVFERRLGVSPMYQKPLVQITGVDKVLMKCGTQPRGSYPGAEQFASKLLTLPLHQGVKSWHLQAIADLL